MGFGIFGGGMDLNREVALCIKKLHQQWEAAVWTSGQVAHQHLSMLDHCVLEVLTGERTVSNDAATVRNVFGQVGKLPRLAPSVGGPARKRFVPLQQPFPTPDPGFQQGMATEGEQRHGAVLHREPSDLRVKDNIALDQTLAMADKSSFVRGLESIAKQEKLIPGWTEPRKDASSIRTKPMKRSSVAERVENRGQLGTGFKLEHAWHHRATWDVSIAPKFIVPDIFHAGNHQRRLGKDNAVHLADGSTVRNQSINGLGVMQTGIGVNSIER